MAMTSRINRWWGLVGGVLLAASDTALILALGITFQVNGGDATLFVGLFFGSSFALLGYMVGWVMEARRRDQEAAAVIREQVDTIAATRSRLAQSEKLAALGQLATAIAHEVRNPLAVIRSAAQGIAETVPAADAATRRSCEFITDEIDRLSSVVTSLLAFARPMQVNARPVPVPELLDRALLLAGEELAARGVAVRCEAGGPLPALHADPDLVCQVLIGLLSNAAEAAGQGGTITIEARRTEKVVELGVADSGPGVPPEMRARIFEPFFTTRARGTGLGLAVARQIVEAHGGQIDVGDGPSGGARFVIRLPLDERTAVAA
ncbi:MAG TPA: ATP-binding protein [Candidatus Binatia bacterium]|nr:ATP-binding protein [Candidatus Binatia bacterium]